MRRYTTLLLTAFVILLLVIVGSAYLAGSGKRNSHALMREITCYTTMPAEQASLLSQAYEQQSHVRVNFVPLSQEEILSRLSSEQGVPQASLILANEETLRRASAKGYLTPFVSESSDAVPEEFRQSENYWTGVWYDPIVFAYNKDFQKTLPHVPDSWAALAAFPNARLSMTDFVAADASAHLFFSMIAQFGDQEAYHILREIHPHVVSYTKYLSNPVRQVGMGEADIAIAVESETLRYLNDGYPVRIVYPADGTDYILTGAGLVAGGRTEEQQAAGSFIDWLLSDEAQIVLQANGCYFVPTNPATIAYQTFGGKNIVLFTQRVDATKEQQRAFLDRWVKYIRFGAESAH